MQKQTCSSGNVQMQTWTLINHADKHAPPQKKLAWSLNYVNAQSSSVALLKKTVHSALSKAVTASSFVSFVYMDGVISVCILTPVG